MPNKILTSPKDALLECIGAIVIYGSMTIFIIFCAGIYVCLLLFGMFVLTFILTLICWLFNVPCNNCWF